MGEIHYFILRKIEGPGNQEVSLVYHDVKKGQLMPIQFSGQVSQKVYVDFQGVGQHHLVLATGEEIGLDVYTVAQKGSTVELKRYTLLKRNN